VSDLFRITGELLPDESTALLIEAIADHVAAAPKIEPRSSSIGYNRSYRTRPRWSHAWRPVSCRSGITTRRHQDRNGCACLGTR